MIVTIRDEATAAELAGVTGFDVAIHGPNGEMLGRFYPEPEMRYPEMNVDVEATLREINDPNTKFYTPEQVMDHLRKLRETL